MKQILQHLGNGDTMLAEVPCPCRANGQVLIETSRSLVSLGTERMLLEFGKGNLLTKARSQPDKVKQVLQKIKTDGLKTTVDAVRAKLDTPITLGYSNVGRVLESDPHGKYAVGTRIVSNGAHAEVVSAAENLTAPIPEQVSDEQAAFTVVGAIGLQGVRLIQPTLGERVVVSGLGLIGLLAVQILRANGCQVLGIDFDQHKLDLARQFGAETVDLSAVADPVLAASEWSQGTGVDAVLVTASTKSDELIHQAASMCRKRGRIVLVGVVGLNLQRADFYEKELSFQVSCSYGPGRYEPNYEKRGLDYPIGFVRWTEQRNFQAVLELMADGKLVTEQLISHRFAFNDSLKAYEKIADPTALGILLDYGEPTGPASQKLGRIVSAQKSARPLSSADGTIGVAFAGAGDFTTRTLLPLLPQNSIRRQTIISGQGVSAAHAAKKFGFATVSTDYQSVLADRKVDAVFVTTPHHLHADMVCQTLAAGKHVFVEKPLALTQDELERVGSATLTSSNTLLMVGFNRRFSPHMTTTQSWLQASSSAKTIIITVNAGSLPAEHWTQDRTIGGGRILGEACHFIDLARFLAGVPITSIHGHAMSGPDGQNGDCATITLHFSNGSMATIHYLANGSKDYPKERVEVFSGQRVIRCDNFRSTREYGGQGRKLKTRGQDKGHRAELEAFVNAIKNGQKAPISYDQLFEVTQATIEVDEQIREQARTAH